jgi:FAD/FMN-containing dehydrogenase
MADQQALQILQDDLGTANVSCEEAATREYQPPRGSPPAAAVRIRDADALVQTVRWAREHKTPLVPVSSSAPHHDACLGAAAGAVMVDLSGMKRVIQANRRNRVTLVEAGVSFEELVPIAHRSGLRPLLPLMPRRGKSMLASYLDREPTIYPKYQWDFADPLLCIEVVYGTGDLFRTGSAAGPGTIEEQWRSKEFQKSPLGPGQGDWVKLVQGAQGGIGIATWCSAKCEVLPRRERLFVAGADQIEPLIEASYRQLHRKLTDIHLLLDRRALASLVAQTPGDMERAAAAASAWNLVYSVSGIEYFPEEREAYLAREAEKEVRTQGARLVGPPLVSEAELLEALLHPDGSVHWRDRDRGAHRSVYFLTTMDEAGHFDAVFEGLADQNGIDGGRVLRYLQPLIGGRACHLEFVVAADPADAADLEKVDAFCAQAARPLIEAGAFFSRPHGAWSQPAMEHAKSSLWIYRKMKDIFDPDHILAPGRLTLGGSRAA